MTRARVVKAYFAIGFILGLAYTFQGGADSFRLLIRMPVGIVAILGWLIAWPAMLLMWAVAKVLPSYS